MCFESMTNFSPFWHYHIISCHHYLTKQFAHIANSVSQNSSSIFTCLSVCMYVCVCSSVTFLFLQTLSSRNLSHGNISQFKFRIRTDYFGLVCQPIFIISTNFHNFNQILQFQPIFTISRKC